MENNSELLPIIDLNGNLIGSATRAECHDSKSFLLHPVVHLHVFDEDGRLLLQQRSNNKRVQPGRWDTAVGGHVDLGESISAALCREAAEEIGINSEFNPQQLSVYQFRSDVEAEMVFSYYCIVSPDFQPSIRESDEIDQLRFWSHEQIIQALGKGILTPNFEQEYHEFLRDVFNQRLLK